MQTYLAEELDFNTNVLNLLPLQWFNNNLTSIPQKVHPHSRHLIVKQICQDIVLMRGVFIKLHEVPLQLYSPDFRREEP